MPDLKLPIEAIREDVRAQIPQQPFKAIVQAINLIGGSVQLQIAGSPSYQWYRCLSSAGLNTVLEGQEALVAFFGGEPIVMGFWAKDPSDYGGTPPGTCSVSTPNFAGSPHTHAVASSSNPGAVASLLASDASGYLQLAGLGIGAAPGSDDLHFGTGVGITHADGVAAGQFLRANGVRYVPDTLDVADITDLAYAVPNLTLGLANAAGAANTVIRTDATILAFDAVVPNVIECDDAAATGAATVAARRDHEHGIVCAAPVNIANANAEGAATSFARSDHEHNHPAGLGVNLHHNEAHVVNSTGPHAEAGLTIGHVLRVSGAAAFAFAAIQAGDLPGIGGVPALVFTTANAAGAATTYVQTDAELAIFDVNVPTTIQCDDAAATGAAAFAARRDHEHAIVCAVPNQLVPDNAQAEGTAYSFARSDHDHQITCAAPGANLSVSSANAEGVAANDFSRSDHSHAITSSSNPGAAASILASDASGYLQLVGLGIGTAATAANSITMVDDAWIGIGAALERIIFDAAGDICIMGASFCVGVASAGGAGVNFRGPGVFSLTDVDVVQPVTDKALAAAYGQFSIWHGTHGGLRLSGINDYGGNHPLVLEGIFGVTNPTDTIPAVTLAGYKSDGGTGVADLAAAETVLQIRNNATALVTILGNGNVGKGTISPDRKDHTEVSDAVTAAVTYAQRLSHITSGAAAAGFGVGMEFGLEDAGGGMDVAATIAASWISAVAGSEVSQLDLAITGGGLVLEGNAVSPNVRGGFSGNSITVGVKGATIGGGGVVSFVNTITDDYGFIGGGAGNQAGDNAGTTSDKPYATIAGGRENVASGMYTFIGGGKENIASGDFSTVVGGLDGKADKYGQVVSASGWFAAIGDCQGTIQMTGGNSVTHSTNAWHTLYLDQTSVETVIATDTVWTFEVFIVGTTQGCTKSFGFHILGVIENDGGTTSMLASTVTTIYDTDDTDFDARANADDAADALQIQVRDSTSGGDTVRWTCTIRTAEVTFPA